MKRAACIVAGVAFAAAIIHAVLRERDCGARGGVLVRGQFDYVCVAAARVAP